jgi:hypothetical protein
MKNQGAYAAPLAKSIQNAATSKSRFGLLSKSASLTLRVTLETTRVQFNTFFMIQLVWNSVQNSIKQTEKTMLRGFHEHNDCRAIGSLAAD